MMSDAGLWHGAGFCRRRKNVNLASRLESTAGRTVMSKLLSLRNRLAKVEQQLADRARREDFANCTCREVTTAIPGQEEEFKTGKRCRAAATASGLCFFHANPDKTSELGRIGGRSKRHSVGESADPLPILDNVLAVRDTVARLIADVYAGKIHPRMAASLAPLINLLLRDRDNRSRTASRKVGKTVGRG